MKEEFKKYLKSIGLTDNLCQRVETIYEFFRRIIPGEITDIFVTDYISEEGSREYENLWFFSPKYAKEAISFITRDHFAVIIQQKHIVGYSIRKQDYNFKKGTEKSRFYLRFGLDNGQTAELKASKENCDYLRDIMLKYIAPNMKQ